MLVGFEAVPLVVYIGELSSPPDPIVSARSELRQCHWRQRRYIPVISSSAECGVGMTLNGTGSGDPCRMYSMYSLDRTNFHSMSWSVCACTSVDQRIQKRRTRNSAIAENPRDTFRGQSRSRPNMVPSHTRTVVRECCKGDDASQWENGKFDPLPPPNPLTDRHKKLHT